MRDVWTGIRDLPEERVRDLGSALESRVQVPAQRRMRGEWLDGLGIRTGQRVLDVGCGTGAETRALAARAGERGLALGVDPSPVLLERARAEARHLGLGSRLQFQVGSAAEPGVKDACFDLAVAATVFTHLAEPEPALRGMLRTLAPGGTLSLFDQDYETLVFDHPDAATTQKVVRANAGELANGIAGRQLYGWLHDLDLAEVQARTFSYVETGQVRYLQGLAERGAEWAVQRGELTRLAAEGWLRELWARSEAGRFFGALTYVAAWGRNPGPPGHVAPRADGGP